MERKAAEELGAADRHHPGVNRIARAQGAGGLLVVAGDHGGRRHVPRDLFGVIWAGQGGGRRPRLLGDDLARTLQRSQLQTLGQRQLQRIGPPPRRHPARHCPHRLSGDRVGDKAGLAQVGVADGYELELAGQLDAGQEVWVAMRAVELDGLLGREGQHLHAMSALPKQPAEGTAPAA